MVIVQLISFDLPVNQERNALRQAENFAGKTFFG